MPLKELFLNFRDRYMRSSVEKMEFPSFPPDDVIRYQLIFSGIVQGVGFRYEMWLIAEKLELTGFVKNLENGDVLAEVQGPKNRIDHLIKCMKSIRRIMIEHIQMTELPPKTEEKEFLPIY